MRIIAGKARGRRLKSPATDAIRPTRDRVRESLFSILGNLDGTVVVDGFAGSGALGLEALSRGAERAYFFDPSREAIETIEENVARVGVEDQAVVKRCRFADGLKSIAGTPDLWFLDPPYNSTLGEEALKALLNVPEILTAGALVVLETGRDEEISVPGGFEREDERLYGATKILFLRRSDAGVAEEEEIS